VAKENNRGSINSAQKAGKTAKSVPKPRGKPSTKRRQTETEVETPSPRKLRKRA
jgi:hypothetical protein